MVNALLTTTITTTGKVSPRKNRNGKQLPAPVYGTNRSKGTKKSKTTHPSTTTQQKQHRNNSIPQQVLHNENPSPMSMLGSEDSNRDETNALALKKKLEDILWKLDTRNREVDAMKEKMEEMAEQETTASVTEDDGMTTISKKANWEILKQHCATNLEEEMKQYVKTSWFCGVKFVTDDDWEELILKEGIASKQVTKPNVPNAQQFYAYNNSIVSQTLAKLRHNAQTLVRKNWMSDMDKGVVVSPSFPHTTRLLNTNPGTGPILHPEYRKKGIVGDEDVYYFVTRILAGISPSHNRFKQSKETELISDIFLVSDEAFGLMILHNKHHVWVNNRDRKKDETIRRERKRYCDAKSGSRDGWMLEGVETFDRVCEELAKLRKQTETGRDLEVKLRDRFRRESNRNYDITSGTTAFAGGGLATCKQKFFIDPVLLQKKIQFPK
eukprot:jgi/Psemu1/36165/gm1.36165_g